MIFIGGIAALVERATKATAKECKLPTFESMTFETNIQSLDATSSSGPRLIEKCGHRYPSDAFCSHCSSNLELVGDQLRSYLEQRDTNISILVVGDLCSSSSIWSYDQVMDILATEVPGCTLGTMLLLPAQLSTGWDAHLMTYCAALSLRQSTYTIVRSLSESLHIETASTQSNYSVSLSQCAEQIAADIVPNFLYADVPTSRYSIAWPYTVAAYSSRVIDVRSSLLYKLQQIRKKKPSRDHQSPLKILAGSIHNLFNYSQAMSRKYGLSESIPGSWVLDYRDLSWDTMEGHLGMGSSNDKMSNSRARTFSHATPGLTWTMVEDLFESNLRSRLMPQCQNEKADRDTTEQVSVTSFQSPFGEREIRQLATCSSRLLHCGAFRHLFNSVFDEDTVRDSQLVIDTYFSRSESR